MTTVPVGSLLILAAYHLAYSFWCGLKSDARKSTFGQDMAFLSTRGQLMLSSKQCFTHQYEREERFSRPSYAVFGSHLMPIVTRREQYAYIFPATSTIKRMSKREGRNSLSKKYRPGGKRTN
jgi:hypothetical protein